MFAIDAIAAAGDSEREQHLLDAIESGECIVFEREGHVSNWEGRAQRLHPVRGPMSLSRPDWQVFQELSGSLELADGTQPPDTSDADLVQIAAAWNDASHASGIEVPDSPEAILVAVSDAARTPADSGSMA